MPANIASIIEPQVFNKYVVHKTNELSAFYQSGIISHNPELDALASAGGRLINMPYWNDLTGNSEVLADGVALNLQGITAGQDVACLLQRGKAWKATDLEGALSGSDPMKVVADRAAAFWARDMQATILKELEGIFANTDMDGNTYKYTTFDKTNAAEEILTAAQKLGDSSHKITSIVCNSADALKIDIQNMTSNNAQYFSDFTGKERTAGRRIIVDDGVPAGTLYLFGEGAIGMGNGTIDHAVEVDRKSLEGIDILINRKAMVLHPRGIAWQNKTCAGLTPTNAELATKANWKRVYESKDIRIVKMVASV